MILIIQHLYYKSIILLHFYIREGEIIPADINSIAIVGSRLPTKYGRTVTEALSGELASLGVTIVSGMARGVDSLAQSKALKMGGRTIGVLGCGIDIYYPPENDKLYDAVAQNGALLFRICFRYETQFWQLP